jgi:hypothetical protein
MDEETGEGDRGSGLPLESEQDAAAGARAELDQELLQDGTGLPFVDALDTGDPGAPDRGLGASGEGSGAPVTARQSNADSDVRAEQLRDRGTDIAADEDEPPLGGPAH